MSDGVSYPYQRSITLRWKDNDVYGHVNNVEYYSFFDTAINEFLIEEAELDIQAGSVIGVCAESRCTFKAPAAFPGELTVGLGVEHLGTSSVRYRLVLTARERSGVLAEGSFVHVFVDRQTRQPTPIPDKLRSALESLL
jgi:acyl-CoA thioester hydrolase